MLDWALSLKRLKYLIANGIRVKSIYGKVNYSICNLSAINE